MSLEQKKKKKEMTDVNYEAIEGVGGVESEGIFVKNMFIGKRKIDYREGKVGGR